MSVQLQDFATKDEIGEKLSPDQIVAKSPVRYRKVERGYLRSYPRTIPRVANSHVLIRARS